MNPRHGAQSLWNLRQAASVDPRATETSQYIMAASGLILYVLRYYGKIARDTYVPFKDLIILSVYIEALIREQSKGVQLFLEIG